MTYTQHPLSAAFPAMSDEDFQELKDSIHTNGVLNPITLFEEQVIDGWHRYRAATELVMKCPSQVMEDWIDPKDFVLAQNKNRRHITIPQKIEAIKAVYSWHPAHRPNKSAVTAGLTTLQVAEKAGTSVRNVERFKEIEKKAVPEVIASVMSGKTGLTKGAELAKLPAGEQVKALNNPLPKPAVKVVEPEAVEPTDYTALDAAQDRISDLQSELVVARMGDIPVEQKQQAATRLAELQAENKTLTATLKAVTLSRDSLLEENSQMKRQMQMQRKEIDKLKNN